MKVSFQLSTGSGVLRASFTTILTGTRSISEVASLVYKRFNKPNARTVPGAMVAWASLPRALDGTLAATASGVDAILAVRPSEDLKRPWQVITQSVADAFWFDRLWMGFPQVLGDATANNRCYILRDSPEVLETVEAVVDPTTHVVSLCYKGVLLSQSLVVHSELLAHAVDSDDLQELLAKDPVVKEKVRAAQATANRAFVRLVA